MFVKFGIEGFISLKAFFHCYFCLYESILNMKIPHFLFLICLIQSCSKTIQQLPPNAKLSAKYVVLDETLSPGNVKCSEDIKAFDEMGENDCSFILKEFEFDIEDKFVLDDKGTVAEFWNYLSEGPVTYSINELKLDTSLFNSIGGNRLLVMSSSDGSAIIDSGDTMKIEQVFPDEKLVFVELDPSLKKNGRRFIYEYKIESVQK